MKIPFLQNVRRGLATNSSSSHSLVFHAHPAADNNLASANYVETAFEWDHFILDSLGAKLMYGLTMAVGRSWSSSPVTPEDVAEAKTRYAHLFPELDSDLYWARAIDGNVDHESRQAVTKELVDKLRDPHVVVHGGNDNGGYPFGMGYGDDDPTLPAGARREMLG